MSKSYFQQSAQLDSKDRQTFPSKTAAESFYNLPKKQRESILDETKITITQEELIHAKRFLALIWLSGGQKAGATDQRKVYVKQGILPNEVANVDASKSIEEKIEDLSKQITAKNIKNFYKRLIAKRPLVFYTPRDTNLAREGKQGVGCLGEKDLEEYINYSEMEIAAMLQVAGPTQFINDGGRHNRGNLEVDPSKYESSGFISAIVGARLEISDGMEVFHCVKGSLVNAETKREVDGNGFGDLGRIKQVNNRFVEGYKSIWNKFYEGHQQFGGNVVDEKSLKQRLYISYKKFIAQSIEQAAGKNKKAYIRVVGLGDGAWSDYKESIIGRVIGQTISQIFNELSVKQKAQISAIEFSQYNHSNYFNGFKEGRDLGASDQVKIDGVDIISSRNAPFSNKIPHQYRNDSELSVNFAWDGGSYVGNEYWLKYLTASGDPAAACCSSITVSMNPDINTKFLDRLEVIGKDYKLQKLEDVIVEEVKSKLVAPAPIPEIKTAVNYSGARRSAVVDPDEDILSQRNINLNYLSGIYGRENLVLMVDGEGKNNYLVKVGNKAQTEAFSKVLCDEIQIRSVTTGRAKIAVPLNDKNEILRNPDGLRYKYDDPNNNICAVIFNDGDAQTLRKYYETLDLQRVEEARIEQERRKQEEQQKILSKKESCRVFLEGFKINDEKAKFVEIDAVNHVVFLAKTLPEAEDLNNELEKLEVRSAGGGKKALAPLDEELKILYTNDGSGRFLDSEDPGIKGFGIIITPENIQTLESQGITELRSEPIELNNKISEVSDENGDRISREIEDPLNSGELLDVKIYSPIENGKLLGEQFYFSSARNIDDQGVVDKDKNLTYKKIVADSMFKAMEKADPEKKNKCGFFITIAQIAAESRGIGNMSRDDLKSCIGSLLGEENLENNVKIAISFSRYFQEFMLENQMFTGNLNPKNASAGTRLFRAATPENLKEFGVDKFGISELELEKFLNQNRETLNKLRSEGVIKPNNSVMPKSAERKSPQLQH